MRPAPEESSRLEINVVFTNVRGTLSALRSAAQLVSGLDARIVVLIPEVVAFPAPLERPPVSPQLLARQLRTAGVDTTLRVLLCRDRDRALAEALGPHTTVVVGGRKRLWLSSAERLARKLRRAGHDVVFAAA